MTSARIDRLRELLEEPLLVTNPTNVRYLTGFRSSNPALLVEPERVQLFSDFRYADAGRAVAASAQDAGIEFVETKRALVKDLADRLSGRIAVEADFITYSAFEALAAGGLELVPRSGLVEQLRAVKDDDELAAIRRAWAITDDVFARLADEPFVGRTEREVAWTLEQLFHEHGAEELSFPLIVAGGPNAARPHAGTSERRIQSGETVVVDAGCRIDGYCSDCTRTFATGPLPPDLRDAYSFCLMAQDAGLTAVRAGESGIAVDAAARTVIEESPFAGTFGHGLGHGVGLDVHETPRLSPESQDTLAPGNVVTVEPGIYLAGNGGIRIEDNVLVTNDGAENLTAVRKELVEVA